MKPRVVTKKEIAEKLHVSERFVIDTLAHDPDFPRPLRYATRPKKWLESRIDEWLEREGMK